MNTEWRRRLLCGIIALSACLPQAVSAAALIGPSAYPPRDADWPGEGAVRLFEYMKQNRQTFWSRRLIDKHSVVFFGDSLTGGWSTLQSDFPDTKVVNRSIGGDVTRGMLFRFQEDVVDLSPRAIVILAGSADLSALQPPEMAVRNIRRMLDILREQEPTALVVLCTVPPRDNPLAPVDASQIDQLNAGLRALAKSSSHSRLLDLHALMSTPTGLDPSMFAPDRLHLSPAGYRAWQKALTPILVNAGLTSVSAEPPKTPRP